MLEAPKSELKFKVPFAGHAVFTSLLFIVLQLFGLIDLPRWAVLVPFVVPGAVLLIIVILAFFAAVAGLKK